LSRNEHLIELDFVLDELAIVDIALIGGDHEVLVYAGNLGNMLR